MKEVNTYFNVPIPRFMFFPFYRIIKWRILKFFMVRSQFNFVKDGILSSIKMLENLKILLQMLYDIYSRLLGKRSVLKKIWKENICCGGKRKRTKNVSPDLKMAHLDYRLRRTVFMEMKTLECMIYEMGWLMVRGKRGKRKHFTAAVKNQGPLTIPT